MVDVSLDFSGRRHRLLDVVTFAACAVLSGAESWVEFAEWGRATQSWPVGSLDLPHEIPAHDACGRIFALMDPDLFEAGFQRWARTDARTAEQRLVLAQAVVDDKADEIATLSNILVWINLTDQTVAIAGMGCR